MPRRPERQTGLHLRPHTSTGESTAHIETADKLVFLLLDTARAYGLRLR